MNNTLNRSADEASDQEKNEDIVQYCGDLVVRDLSFTVQTWTGSWWACGCCRKTSKRVLDKLNVTVQKGQLVAFIGNSGSGKTSLLNAVANRQSGKKQGSILLAGEKLTHDVFANKGAYVIQSDRLLARLTVRESLQYTAHILLNGKYNKKQINKKVESILEKISLTHVADSRVGGLVERGISGGEKRRLSIAIQLLRDPDLIILDEPTTGLDSYTAHYLVKTLASLAHNDNKMIVMAIHQPRSDIYHLLDTVGILSGGNMVYYGPRKNLVPHFTSGYTVCYDKFSFNKYVNWIQEIIENPIKLQKKSVTLQQWDNRVDLCSIDRRSGTREDHTAARVTTLTEAYHNSAMYSGLNTQTACTELHTVDSDVEMYEARTRAETTGNLPDIYSDSETVLTVKEEKLDDNTIDVQYQDNKMMRNPCLKVSRFFGIVGVLIERMYVTLWRDKPMFLSRIYQVPAFALYLWLFVWRVGSDTVSIQDRLGIIYQCLAIPTTAGILTATPLFSLHRNVYFRESGDGLYSCVHFLVAYYVHIIPGEVVSCIAFSLWSYWALGLNPEAVRFFRYVMVLLIQMHIGELQTVCLLSAIDDQLVAQTISTLMITISTLYASGILKSSAGMNAPMKYLAYINHCKYAAEIFAANEFDGLDFTCEHIAPNCTIPGTVVLDGLFPDAVENVPRNFGILAAMIVVYWISAIICFLIRGRKVLH